MATLPSDTRFLSEYNVLLCCRCQYAVRQQHLSSHFRTNHKYSKAQVQELLRQHTTATTLDENFKRFGIPESVKSPIPDLALYNDGLRCEFNPAKCQYICRREHNMKQHLRTVHDYSEFRQTGRPTRQQTSQLESKKWVSVVCQRLFPSGPGSRFFEVRTITDSAPTKISSQDPQFWTQLNERRAAIQKAARNQITAVHQLEREPWLDRTGWPTYLIDFDRTDLMNSVKEPNPIQEPYLWTIWNTVGELAEASQDCTVRRAGVFVRLQILRTEPGQRPPKPIQAYLAPKELQKAARVWCQILMFLCRTQQPHEWSSPPYEFNSRQKSRFERLDQLVMLYLRPASHSPSPPPSEIPSREPTPDIKSNRTIRLSPLHYACLDFIISLLDQRVRQYEYECPLICSLAILGVSEGRWKGPYEFPSILSALLKMARFFVVQSAFYQADSAPPRTESPSVISLVQEMVDRFMCRNTYSPIDWVLDLRAYGMKLASNLSQEGHISWIRDQLHYQDLSFTMANFRSFVRGLLWETKRILHEDLLILPQTNTTLPTLRLDLIRDNPVNKEVDFSFTQRLTPPGECWLQDRIRERPSLRTKYFPTNSTLGTPAAVRAYFRTLQLFRTKLLLLLYITGGQPPRLPELWSIRVRNSPNGGIRNVFIEDGMVVLVTQWHKGYTIQARHRIIHRYLPYDAGLILVHYLWLVLPFVERLQMVYNHITVFPSFLWPEFASRELWASDFVRHAMENESMIGLGGSINIRTYRQLVVAITRKFLQPSFQFVDEEGDDDEYGSKEVVPGNAFDRQAAHHARTAALAYGRTITDRPYEIESERVQSRLASQAWHTFLQLPSTQTSTLTYKRQLSSYEEDQAQQRWVTFRTSDPFRQLQQLYGVDATFRPGQADILHAVLRGESPILAVMPTGGGKSLLFMLPASYGLRGVTIVIVPLVALRTSLVQRCEELNISCQEWNPRQPGEDIAIIFITPEAAVRSEFFDYVNVLRVAHRLDRIVVDECHLILDPSKDFRPAIYQLYRFVKLETQLIFLTATLPPSYEVRFWRELELQHIAPTIFRQPTRRGNITYQVLRHGKEKMIHLLRRLCTANISGRTVIYCSSVSRTEEIGFALTVPVYHAQICDREEILRDFLSGKSRTITATSALGMGVDVSDISLVIHVGAPRNLIDYVQESGRGGREIPSCTAIVILGPHEHHHPDQFVRQFLFRKAGETECRRIILDQYLDGENYGQACQDGESLCDMCLERTKATSGGRVLPTVGESISTGVGVGMREARARGRCGPSGGGTEEGVSEAVVRTMISERGIVRGRQIGQKCREIRQGQGLFLERVRQGIETLFGVCLLCYGERGEGHLIEECVRTERTRWASVGREMRGGMQLERFSGCQWCWLPQGLCQRWQGRGGGRFFLERGVECCSYEGFIIEAAVGIVWEWGGGDAGRLGREAVF